MINDILHKLESVKTPIKNQPEGTIDVVPFELVKELLQRVDTHIVELENKLNEFRRLLYKTN